MKEIIVNSTGKICYKVIIFDNSVSFVEEYSSDTSEKQQYRTSHYNVSISDIQHIKYAFAEETIKSQTKALPFALAILLFIAAVVMLCLKIWVGGGITFLVSIIMVILGFITRSPETATNSQSLIIENKEKIIYQKKVQLTDEKLLDIINSIREKQPHLG